MQEAAAQRPGGISPGASPPPYCPAIARYCAGVTGPMTKVSVCTEIYLRNSSDEAGRSPTPSSSPPRRPPRPGPGSSQGRSPDSPSCRRRYGRRAASAGGPPPARPGPARRAISAARPAAREPPDRARSWPRRLGRAGLRIDDRAGRERAQRRRGGKFHQLFHDFPQYCAWNASLGIESGTAFQPLAPGEAVGA